MSSLVRAMIPTGNRGVLVAKLGMKFEAHLRQNMGGLVAQPLTQHGLRFVRRHGMPGFSVLEAN